MAITPIIGPSLNPAELLGRVDNDKENKGFADVLGKALNGVNKLLVNSDMQSQKLSIGKSENLHSAMIAFEKAESAFKLLVQVRNKALEAYNEIMRMQV